MNHALEFSIQFTRRADQHVVRLGVASEIGNGSEGRNL